MGLPFKVHGTFSATESHDGGGSGRVRVGGRGRGRGKRERECCQLQVVCGQSPRPVNNRERRGRQGKINKATAVCRALHWMDLILSPPEFGGMLTQNHFTV